MEQQRLTNNTGLPMSMAVWLAHDEYDYQDDPFYLSVTTLIKSPRQIILGLRKPDNNGGQAADVADAMSRAVGNAVHNAIEDVWTNHRDNALRKLGLGENVIKKIKVNPDPADVMAGECIPVYMEQRAFATVGRWSIGGKFDFIGDGSLEDFKTTGTYSYTSGSNEWKYYLQGSLYRWLNPDLITSDHMLIDFVFTDWSKKDSMIKAKAGYPPTKIFAHKILLKSIPETERWVQDKIALIESLIDAPEAELPLCEPKDLWQDAPTFKYYKNPAKTERSTKNYSNLAEAELRRISDGSVGAIHEVASEAKGCKYCDVYNQCSQKDHLIASGTLK